MKRKGKGAGRGRKGSEERAERGWGVSGRRVERERGEEGKRLERGWEEVGNMLFFEKSCEYICVCGIFFVPLRPIL